MDQVKQQKLVAYGMVAALTLVSFFISYASFSVKQRVELPTTTTEDVLSGEQYTPTTNEENPFGPYFVGFDTLADRGVTTDEFRYIYDVLTNFAMYNQRVYGSKVSYVKGSFERQTVSGIEPRYTFKFGINNARIHAVSVASSILTENITIIINNQDGHEVFNRTFQIH